MAGKVTEYQRNDTLGKSQLDLVIKVYDGAINAFKTAKKNYLDNEPQKGYEQLFLDNMGLLKNYADGRTRNDNFRSPLPKGKFQ